MRNKRILTLVFAVAFLTLLVGCLTPPNQRPIITSDPVITAEIGVDYAYEVKATDSDGHVLTYSLTVKPEGMAIDPGTGKVTWTPDTTGSFGVTVKVSDGAKTDTQSFYITVSKLVDSYSYLWTTTIINSTDFDFTVGMGWSGPFPWPPNVYFFFHPDEIPLGGYIEPIGGAWLFENIDFDITSAGQTFSVTSVADDPDFEDFANLLTDGTDEWIWFGYMGNRDNIASAGGQMSMEESDVETDFPGWVIYSVSLTFNHIYLDSSNVNKLVLDFTIDIYAGLPKAE